MALLTHLYRKTESTRRYSDPEATFLRAERILHARWPSDERRQTRPERAIPEADLLLSLAPLERGQPSAVGSDGGTDRRRSVEKVGEVLRNPKIIPREGGHHHRRGLPFASF